MKILYERDKNKLIVEDVVFTVTNNVRNEIDPLYVRKLHDPKEVRYTVSADRSKGKPYMPRKFPKGTWKTTGVERYAVVHGKENFDQNEYGTVRIRTDAHQKVSVWALDKNGGYDHETSEMVEDYGYLFHFAPTSMTTLGCGRMISQDATNKFASLIEKSIDHETITLEVV